jgi:hypothetical protein
MQLDLLDAAAVAVSVLVLILALVFIYMIWTAALGHPVFHTG